MPAANKQRINGCHAAGHGRRVITGSHARGGHAEAIAMSMLDNKPMTILVIMNLVSLAVIFWLLWMINQNVESSNNDSSNAAHIGAMQQRGIPLPPESKHLTNADDVDWDHDVRDHAALAELSSDDAVNVNEMQARAASAISTFKPIDVNAPQVANQNALAQDDAVEENSGGSAAVGNNKQPPSAELSPGEKAYLDLLKSASAERANEIRFIRVRRGDTLWKISRRAYGSGFKHKQILKANPHLKSPNDITVGEYLRVPQ